MTILDERRKSLLNHRMGFAEGSGLLLKGKLMS